MLLPKSIVLASLALVAAGCVKDTLNQECTLKFADGGPIPEAFAREQTLNNKDFISVGATECDSLFCVRDSSFKGSADGGDAKGYCSDVCLKTGTVCQSSPPENNPPGPNQLKCRVLLLSEEVLADPQVRSSLGGITTSLFCARGLPDAGR